jgi:hypothetical protein
MTEVRLGDTQRICAVCGRVLVRFTKDTDPNFERWDHSEQDQLADHPAVAVRPDQVMANYRCDFCNTDQDGIHWSVPARNFPMPFGGGTEIDASDGDWAACNECAALITAENWAGLINRCSAMSPAVRSGEAHQDLVAVQLARVYHRLRAHMTGPPHAATPAELKPRLAIGRLPTR